jgi:hypothetical protein
MGKRKAKLREREKKSLTKEMLQSVHPSTSTIFTHLPALVRRSKIPPFAFYNFATAGRIRVSSVAHRHAAVV